MKNNFGDIKVTIHIRFNEYITSDRLVNIVTVIERSVYKQEKILLKKLRKEFSNISTVFFDAAEFRLLNSKGKTLHIKSATEGSIILTGIAIGLSYWLLNQTLGETVKEAWVESENHEKLKKYLKTNLFSKSKNIEKDIKSELNKKGINSEIETIENNKDKENKSADVDLDVYIDSSEDD